MFSRSYDRSQADANPSRKGSMNDPFDLNKTITAGFNAKTCSRSRPTKDVDYNNAARTLDHNTAIQAWWASRKPSAPTPGVRAKSITKPAPTTNQINKCVSCLDVAQQDDSGLLNCGHAWCCECLNTHFRRLSEETNPLPPRCCWKENIDVAAIAHLLEDEVWNAYALMRKQLLGHPPNTSKKISETSVSSFTDRKAGSMASGTTLNENSVSGLLDEKQMCRHDEIFHTTAWASETFKPCPGCEKTIESPQMGGRRMALNNLNDDHLSDWYYDWSSNMTRDSDDASSHSNTEGENQPQSSHHNNSYVDITDALKSAPPFFHEVSYLDLADESSTRGRSRTPIELNVHAAPQGRREWEGAFAHAICANWNARSADAKLSPTVNITLHDWTSDEEPEAKARKGLLLRRTFDRAVGSVKRPLSWWR